MWGGGKKKNLLSQPFLLKHDPVQADILVPSVFFFSFK